MPGARPRLLVAERFAGVARPGNVAGALFVGEARRISTLASPNLGRVRELVVRGDDLVVFWEFIDGEKLAEMWPAGGLPLDVALRLILDVLSGVGSIHGLRDARQQPMGLAHGEVSPATIVVGVDGAAKVLHAIGRRLPGAGAERASLGYLAPEVHAAEPHDARADVFGVGVMLWEALSAKRLFAEDDAAAIVARVRGGEVIPPAAPGKSSWALGLGQIAAKAMAPLPADRWPTASAMAAEIRKAAGLRLAPATTAATFAKTGLSERAKTRRDRLESLPGGLLPPMLAPAPVPMLAPAPVPMLAPAPVPVVAEPMAAADAGIDADVDLVSASLVPPAASPAVAALAAFAPPLPARALKPVLPSTIAYVGEAAAPFQPPSQAVWSADQAASVPYFEAAVDLPVSSAAPARDSFDVSSTSGQPSAEPPPFGRVSARRTAAVLGGVGAVGLIVLSLAAWKVSHQAGASAASLPRAPHAQTDAPVSGHSHPDSGWHPAAPTAAPAQAVDPEAATSPTTRAPAMAAPTAAHAVAASRSTRFPAPTTQPAVSKSSSVGSPARRPATPRPTRPTPRPTSGFDPGSL
jgi:hypothetical protein